MTLDSLQKFFLKDGLGVKTKHKVPTLEQALLAIKGKAMINLDKCYDFFPEAYQLLVKTNTVDHAIMKSYETYEKVKKDFGFYLDKVVFMPIVKLDRPDAQAIIDEYQTKLKPLAFEINYRYDTSKVLAKFKEIRNKGSRVWNNSLWESQNAGHDDERAVYDLDGSYGWSLSKGINIIQTDRPLLLIKYLEKAK
jgi:glycerophosphoryl diester phosphodiesterase